MPNKKSAIKELRKTKKRTANNARIKTNVKHLYKECVDLMSENKTQEAKEIAAQFQQAIDKAAKRRVISTNRARRKKAAISKILNGKANNSKPTKATKKPKVEVEAKAE